MILCGDALAMLKTLPDDGRIRKGQHLSPATEFKSGEHWRERKPCWSRQWLENEYVTKKRTCSEIAHDLGVTENAIQFWLKKHGIKGRSVKEVRQMKHWGAAGPANPMYGKVGKLNPRWNGGGSPERQSIYASHKWKVLAKAVKTRDGKKCVECGSTEGLHLHHIKAWSSHPELRFDEDNIITLCSQCHKKAHARRKQW